MKNNFEMYDAKMQREYHKISGDLMYLTAYLHIADLLIDKDQAAGLRGKSKESHNPDLSI